MKPALDSQYLHRFLRSRQSIRRFLDRPVEADVLQRVLESGIRAPSAHNRQPWRFAVLTSPTAKTRLAEAMGEDFRRDLLADGVELEEAAARVRRSRQRILSAPVVVVLCLSMVGMDRYPDAARQQNEYLMAVQSVALAGGTLLLAAHAEGLGGVWICAPLFAQETVRCTLELPEDWQPQGMLLLGYPAESPPLRERLAVEEVALFL